MIQKVGEKMTPSYAQSQGRLTGQKATLQDRSILVVDADDEVRAAAHSLLERQGCIVETARDGNEAISMVKAAKRSLTMQLSLTFVARHERVPAFSKLQDVIDSVPLILMTGFGYDPGH